MRTVTGVATSVTAFIGRTRKGPIAGGRFLDAHPHAADSAGGVAR